MNRSISMYGVALAATLTVCLLGSAAARAQNLLTNPGLEGLSGFTIPPGSCPRDGLTFWSYQCINEIEPPTWWYPFWVTGSLPADPSQEYRRPEFRMYGWPDGPHFAYEGSHYLVYFGFWDPIDGGIYQRVTGLVPGATYEFSYQAFAWSNCLEGKVPGSGQGCSVFPDNHATFTAGIDPTGGTNDASPNIVWSEGVSIYDQYDRISVHATAETSALTVFVRCVFYQPDILHNDAHIDALQLIPIGGPQIELGSDEIRRTIVIGVNDSASDTFTIRNSGDDVLSYTISSDSDWLDVSPPVGTSSGEPDTVVVSYDISQLPPDLHVGVITVSSDSALNSPQTITVHLTLKGIPGDMDNDGDVDQTDFGWFQACFTGPGTSQNDRACRWARLDEDEDVDADDFGIFQTCMSGVDMPADPTCAN